MEEELLGTAASAELPESVVRALRAILKANRAGDVGFRRDNMAALLWRYFVDMRQNLMAVQHVLRKGATAFYVVGDSKTKAGDSWHSIETCNHIAAIGSFVGLETDRLMDISVTTENFKHIKNAITENAVIRFKRS